MIRILTSSPSSEPPPSPPARRPAPPSRTARRCPARARRPYSRGAPRLYAWLGRSTARSVARLNSRRSAAGAARDARPVARVPWGLALEQPHQQHRRQRDRRAPPGRDQPQPLDKHHPAHRGFAGAPRAHRGSRRRGQPLESHPGHSHRWRPTEPDRLCLAAGTVWCRAEDVELVANADARAEGKNADRPDAGPSMTTVRTEGSVDRLEADKLEAGANWGCCPSAAAPWWCSRFYAIGIDGPVAVNNHDEGWSRRILCLRSW